MEFNYDHQIHQLIYLDDYIDRGPDSCKVVNEVMREVLEEDAIALLGNHERMMLNALVSEPNKNRINDMLLWLRQLAQNVHEMMMLVK